MSIQWYPGHMHKATKEIRKIINQVDLIIEVLDARIPYSSENPMIAELRGDKPTIKVLTKSDLADPDTNQLWLDYFDSKENSKAIKSKPYWKQTVNRSRRNHKPHLQE